MIVEVAPPDLIAAVAQKGLQEVEPLGEGGFADVYRAVQVWSNREVAVKVFRTPIRDELARRLFESECRALGLLDKKPHVLQVYYADVLGDGRPYLVTELCRATLHGLVRDDGPLCTERVLRYGLGLAKALLQVHDNDLFHGDVTPQNVFLDDSNIVLLADFGMAVRARREGSVAMGFNPDHAAPEMQALVLSTAATDVFGLGSTLYTTLIGEPPPAVWPDSRAERDAHVRRRIEDGQARWHRSAEVIELISRMVAEDHAHRPSMVQVHDSLLSLHDDAKEAPETQRPRRPWSPPAPKPQVESTRRRLMVAGSVVLVLAVVGIVLALAGLAGGTQAGSAAPQEPSSQAGSAKGPVTTGPVVGPAGPTSAGSVPAVPGGGGGVGDQGPEDGSAEVVAAAAPGTNDPPPDPVFLRIGKVTGLVAEQGLDVDTGEVAPEDVLGVDVSPGGSGNHLYGMTYGRADLALLPDAGAEDERRCTGIPDARWIGDIDDVYQLEPGRQICVRSDEGRFAMLTIERTPSARAQTIDFRYIVWG